MPSFRRSVKCWKTFGFSDEMRSTSQLIEAVERQVRRNINRLHVLSRLKSLTVKVSNSSTDAELNDSVQANSMGTHDATSIALAAGRSQLIGSLAQVVNMKARQKLEMWIAATNTAIERARLVKELEDKLYGLQRWLKPTYLGSLASTLKNGTMTTINFRALKEYLPRLPKLCAFSSARASVDPLIDKTLTSLEAGMGNKQTQNWSEWQAILQYSAFSIWISSCIKQTPVLQSLTPELYDRDRKSLAGAIAKQRSLEVETVRDK